MNTAIVEIRPITEDERNFLEVWSWLEDWSFADQNTLATVLDNGVSQVVLK